MELKFKEAYLLKNDKITEGFGFTCPEIKKAYLLKNDKITEGFGFTCPEINDVGVTRENQKIFTIDGEKFFKETWLCEIFFDIKEANNKLLDDNKKKKEDCIREIKELTERLKELNNEI